DPGEIDSALVNLALNARDAMPAGGTLIIASANIKLEAGAGSPAHANPGDYVRVTVTDTGHGMAPDVLARATEPVFTTKEIGKGTGLGLSSVFGLCKQSGGFLAIESTVDQGTVISMYLPRSEADDSLANECSRIGEVPSGDGQVILVVEDNEQLRK